VSFIPVMSAPRPSLNHDLHLTKAQIRSNSYPFAK
jgi:hypothetical protein